MRTLITSLLLVLVLSGASWAGPVEDSIVRQLTSQGFGQITVSRTFLGRSRIVAQRDDVYREVIVNPVTGEILRDYLRRRSGQRPALLDPKGWFDDDDDDHDDDDDRDDDDGDDHDNSGPGSGGDDDGDHDNSGPGSENSGKGSGNSGSGGGDDD